MSTTDQPNAFIKNQPLTVTPVTSDTTLVDDPTALVDSPTALSNGPAAISEGLSGKAAVTVPLPRVHITR